MNEPNQWPRRLMNLARRVYQVSRTLPAEGGACTFVLVVIDGRWYLRIEGQPELEFLG